MPTGLAERQENGRGVEAHIQGAADATNEHPFHLNQEKGGMYRWGEWIFLQNSRLGGGVSERAQVAAYVLCPGLLNMADISLRGLASTTSFICLAEGSRRDMYII